MLIFTNFAAPVGNPEGGNLIFNRGETTAIGSVAVTSWFHFNTGYSTNWAQGQGASLMQLNYTQSRWRASKGSAPVGRFTRAMSHAQTDGWHLTQPVATVGGVAAATGLGSATLLLNGSGSGSVLLSASGAAALSLLTVGSGSLAISGVGTTALRVGTSAAGSLTVQGVGTTGLTLTAAGIGDRPVLGTGLSTLTVGGTGVGTVRVQGVGSSPLTLSASGSASVPLVQILSVDSTLANTGWSPVGAATLQAALTTGDADYIRADVPAATAQLSLGNPTQAASYTNAVIVIRARVA